MTTPPSPPASLGDHYTIDREIGRGGMAAVYGAHDRRHNRAAIAGNTDPALDYMDRAIDLGFRNTAWLRHDPDLDNIRKHPRFDALVARVRRPDRLG